MSVVSNWHPLRQLRSLALIGLAFTAADASALALIMGDQQGLSFLSDAALEGLGELMRPGGRLQLLDLSGCIELTDAGG
jgi:hypothetical protein